VAISRSRKAPRSGPAAAGPVAIRVDVRRGPVGLALAFEDRFTLVAGAAPGAGEPAAAIVDGGVGIAAARFVARRRGAPASSVVVRG